LGEIHSGEIFLNGKPTANITSAELATLVAFVTTDKVRIANLRCRDVVALGRAPYTNWIGRMQQQDNEIVEQSLAAVGMSDYADKTMDRMSDGECQRIMIARALAQQTPIILLDEPTAFLDMPNRYELCTLLRKLAHEENKCILFSTHELDIALELCDSVAIISPPQLHILPTEEMVRSGHIERLFTTGIVSFNPETRTVNIKK
jgi:iron complex transport system ATP-binding protein